MPSPPPKSALLPVSYPPHGGGGGDESFSKGSPMTRRGALAALSYMSCAVIFKGVHGYNAYAILILQAVILLSCILAFFLNYSISLNTTLNSAVTQTMCASLKDLFTVGLGWILFGGLPFDLLNVIGQGLGFLDSAFYAYCKLKGK